VHKFFNPIDHSELANGKKPFKRSKIDTFLGITGWCPVIYYIFDVSLSYLTGNIFTSCGASFGLHHITSIIALPFVLVVPYWPWWWLGPGALHAVLLAFPEELWINYIYLTVIVIFHIGLYQKPWTNLSPYKWMKYTSIGVEFSVFWLWFFVCKNTL